MQNKISKMKHNAILLAGLMLCGCFGKKPQIKTGLEGSLLPSFDILLSDSVTRLNTHSTKKGKPAILYFFSPHCPYCRALMHMLISESKTLRNAQIYAVTNAPYSEMKAFCKRFELNKYSYITVGIDYQNTFFFYYHGSVVPYIAIYDGDMRLRKVFIGMTTPKEINKAIID